jgi:hypothetical protein
MSKFALLKNNFVENIIVADSLEEAQVLGNAVESTIDNSAYLNWGYNPETKLFFDPNPPIIVDETIITEETNA